ncbi:hypothetical protein TraAM80_09134 [Trypanosoma rangeli]|uniref:Uncharacterized protein n=1 Tax=Trypanosoma rangeli TaxID=5698 RepID=A0A3R7JW64_TRYRA|nr:uncharacterized protein TraAM80_09134 [Trypanosoma rangeli]RNE97801.1 hypothetical protein TraAM80_09134 [Trypanosoma rangeli]|eukprot:RNE97801.1 hypothetical protein TraAM80_09134 [Trypanosoma rangeli]
MQSLRPRTRYVESILHDVGASLRQFQGSNGLRCLFDQGKLSLLSAMGEFKQSSDAIFDTRMKVVSQTRVSILKLSDYYAAVGKTVETLFLQIDDLLSELYHFKEICENHLEMTNECASEDAGFGSINSMKIKLGALSRELVSDIRTNCCGIQASSLEQIDKIYMSAKCDVGRAQTAFDVKRRNAQVYEEELFVTRSKGSQNQVKQMEFKLHSLLERLHESGNQYHDALRDNMKKTSFLLEQTSMTTWSAANVFFLQLGTFFKDAMSGFEVLVGAFSSVKNNLDVSRRINLEKQAAAASAVAATSFFYATATPRQNEEEAGPTMPLTHELVDLFSPQRDDGFASHLNLTEYSENQGTREFFDVDDLLK